MLLSMMAILQCKKPNPPLMFSTWLSAYQLVYGSRQKGRTIVVDKPSGRECSLRRRVGVAWPRTIRPYFPSLPEYGIRYVPCESPDSKLRDRWGDLYAEAPSPGVP